MLFGGAALNSKRYIWWNFVSSSKDRIEMAKEEWRIGRFDIVPGDEEELWPLPVRRCRSSSSPLFSPPLVMLGLDARLHAQSVVVPCGATGRASGGAGACWAVCIYGVD